MEITDLGKEGFTFKAIVTVRPVITLKQYKGLEADKVLPTVTDAAVDNELKQYVDRATQLEPVDRAAEMGDSMVMDYEGVKDGVPSRAALPRAMSWRWAPTPSFPASRSRWSA